MAKNEKKRNPLKKTKKKTTAKIATKKNKEIEFKSGSAEAKLLAAKSPDEYIDICIKVNITSGQKAAVSRIWCRKTGYTSKDIMFARNRHPYWKKQKMKNSYERNKARLEEHNYSDEPRKRWKESDFEKFIDLMKDHNNIQIAQKLKRSLASVNALKRRIAAGEKIMASENKKMTPKKLMEFISTDEKKLLALVKEIKGSSKKNTKSKK